MAVTIQIDDLVKKFQYALDNKWGYILNTWHTKWTQALQNEKVKYMKTTYGSDWQNSDKAKKDSSYSTAMYGDRWIGKWVTDCSGLFYWAFKELGGYMYHGSNTMWKKYCVAQGKLINGKRDDKAELKPGTAVFVLKNNTDRSHVGLYIGNGKVIEASGTKSGVITTAITNTKWAEWGELKGVLYGKTVYIGGDDNKIPGTDNSGVNVIDDMKPVITVGSAVVNAAKVALRSAPSTNASIITRVDKGERVQVLDNDWTKVSYQSRVGYMMTKFLNT